MKRLPYYKAYPRDFIEGTIGMPFELKAAYRLLIDLIYVQSGKLPDDPRYIAGYLGCSVRAWNKYKKTLIELGKIKAENGIISNDRADRELEDLTKLQEIKRHNRSASNKNKGLEFRSNDDPEPEPEPYNSFETSVSKDAKPPSTSDFTKDVFDRGVVYLGSFGITEKAARSLIGKWRKNVGEIETFDALREATRNGVTDPVAWITARLDRLGKQPDLDALFLGIQKGVTQ